MSVPPPTAFLGLSHLGTVSSIGWASLGGTVVGVDVDRRAVDSLSAGKLPVHEPGLDALFATVRGRMTFSSDPAALPGCELLVISRDVPTAADDASDVGVVLELVDLAVPFLGQDVVIAIMSQVPPGFTRQLVDRIRTRCPGLRFRLYYWVETLVFGKALERFMKPERIMIGCEDPAAALPPQLDTGLRRFGAPIIQMTYESAELAKTAINLYLCAAVTYANTLAELCERVGANWSQMVPALRLDERIGPAAYIRPSLGIAGGNLERDMVTLRELCRRHGVDGSFIDAMLAYNARRYSWVRRKLDELVFAAVPRPVLAVWGLAYKKNTRSTKNSMALRVIEDLRGAADIRAYDPLLGAADVDVAAKIVRRAEEALDGADALLILTDWDDFATVPAGALGRMRTPLLIDCVGVVDRRRSDLRGARYVAMGEPA
jgi:UDPglucose 6-dehydrogenase